MSARPGPSAGSCDDARAFVAHLAALARALEPEDRAGIRALTDVVRDWATLAASDTPSFEFDGSNFRVGATVVALPSAWRDALAPFEASLRAHGVGGVKLSGPIDRGTVLALLRGVRALPPHAPREELERWVLAHGGGALTFTAPRPLHAVDPRDALRPCLEAWAAFAGAAERPLSDPHVVAQLEAGIRALVDRAREEPRALPVALALAEGGAPRRPACVVTLALILGLRLGLPRAALFDLALVALETSRLTPGFTAADVGRVIARRAARGVGQTEARIACALWVLASDGALGSRGLHLFGRVATLALHAERLLRDEGPARLLPDEAVARLQTQVGRAHDAALVEALVSSLGRYPVGSTIVLESGEVGVVCRPPASGDQVARPLLRVVVDRTGVLLGGGPILDLAQPARARTRIIATIDPARLGIRVAEAVLG